MQPGPMPHSRPFAFRSLAVTTAKRCYSIPNVPTLAESGYPAYVVQPWSGTSDASGDRIRKDYGRWVAVIKAANIKAG